MVSKTWRALAITSISFAVVVIGYFAFRKVDKMPGLAVLYCDTTAFTRMVNIAPSQAPTSAEAGSSIPALQAEYGSLFFKYFIEAKQFNLHAWSFKPGRGPAIPDFDMQPDLKLNIGNLQPAIKFYTGDYIGDFLLNKSNMVLVQNAYRENRMGFVLFYPERSKNPAGIHWRIVLSRNVPLGDKAYMRTDTSGVNTDISSDTYLNPIPPKGMNRVD